MINDNSFTILNREVGYHHDPLIIAEIGINHGGSLEVAKKMAKLAIDSGVDVVKHQTHIVEDEMSEHANSFNVDYIGKSIYQLMDECSLDENEEFELKKFVEANGAIFLSTPFSRAAADRLREFDVPAYKIGSGECNNYPLVDHIASFGKPVILSTGMNSIESVRPAAEIIQKYNVPFALLHTTNIYPTPNHLVRLDGIKELSENFPNAVIGFSDHTVTNHACFGAVALGASILERHFTDTMDREGPDIVNSMDPEAARDLVEGSKIIKQSRGGKKGPIDEESSVIEFAFSSVVTIKEIKKGEAFTKDNIWVKRPGTGYFSAGDFESIIGRIASNDLDKDHQLTQEDLTY
tara:strand:+ start:4792 stop:5841 length:1050 start_codon:yes stop_codon:yes gene_type:complete